MFAAHVMIESCHSKGKRPTRIDEGTLHTKCKTHHNICGGAFGDFCFRSPWRPQVLSVIFVFDHNGALKDRERVQTISPPTSVSRKQSAHPSKQPISQGNHQPTHGLRGESVSPPIKKDQPRANGQKKDQPRRQTTMTFRGKISGKNPVPP